jgi:hypothetical protein
MSYSKEILESLSLVEVKHICKNRNLPITGGKSKLINLILENIKPETVTINKHKSLDNNKKIIGIKLTDKEELIKMGKMVEKQISTFSYFSMGVCYYLVNKNLI